MNEDLPVGCTTEGQEVVSPEINWYRDVSWGNSPAPAFRSLVPPYPWWQRKGHEKWAEAAESQGHKIKDIEHFRLYDDRFDPNIVFDEKLIIATKIRYGHRDFHPAYTHIAVVCMDNRECFVGVHRTARDKAYVRKVSYRAAVGKALARAGRSILVLRGPILPDFYVDEEFEKRDLYNEVKKQLEAAGRFRP